MVERGIEGGYNFLDGLAGVDACSMMNRFYEHFELLKMNEKPNFFVTHTDMPYKVVDYSVRHYTKQMRIRLLDIMEKHYGVDTSVRLSRSTTRSAASSPRSARCARRRIPLSPAMSSMC